MSYYFNCLCRRIAISTCFSSIIMSSFYSRSPKFLFFIFFIFLPFFLSFYSFFLIISLFFPPDVSNVALWRTVRQGENVVFTACFDDDVSYVFCSVRHFDPTPVRFTFSTVAPVSFSLNYFLILLLFI